MFCIISLVKSLSPNAFVTVLAAGIAVYYIFSVLFGGSSQHHHQQHNRSFEEDVQPLPPPVQLGEISEDDLKAYDGNDPQKPLLMAIKGQIYDVTQSREGRYGIPRAGSSSIDEQQGIQHLNQVSARNTQQSDLPPGSLPGTDRGLRMLPGGTSMGVMSGMNRGMAMARPAFQGVAPPSMLNPGVGRHFWAFYVDVY